MNHPVPPAAEASSAARSAPTAPAVVLVGPPGSGKTTVGQGVSQATGLAFRDTDADVEHLAGRSVPDIFADDGEEHFRELERAAVAAALAGHDGVLALGGGAVMSPQTRAALAGHTVVFLNVSMPVGVRRTGLAANRPLLVGVNPRAMFKALLDERLPVYREVATIEIDTDDLSVDEVVDVVVDRLGLAADD